MKSTSLFLLAGGLALAAIGGAWVARETLERPPAPELQYGTLLPDARAMPHFALTDQTGAAFDETKLRGNWNLMFFGFTHCPEICPTTLALLADVRKRFDTAAPRVVFVSVDPERDTPEVIAAYVKAFDPAMIGLTGSPPAIDEFAAALGIAHRKVPMSGDEYMVDHTAAVFVIDPRGRRVAVFSPPFDASQIASDLRRLLGSA
jgi:protein SCO1/2